MIEPDPPPPRADLHGSRVLVTGATSGLGKAMASALSSAGARVAVTGRDMDRVQAGAARLGPTALACALDVRDEQSVDACVRQVVDAWGGIDLLVNNAGIGMRSVNPRFMTDPEPFWQVSPPGFRDIVETKLIGGFLVARSVVPMMLAQGGGRIVNVSMSAATMVRRGFAPYGPAGAGLEALSRVMAADLAGSSITVNLLLPGGIKQTGMVPDDLPTAVRQRMLAPEVMGPPIVWLASEKAAGLHDRRIIATEFAPASAPPAPNEHEQ